MVKKNFPCVKKTELFFTAHMSKNQLLFVKIITDPQHRSSHLLNTGMVPYVRFVCIILMMIMSLMSKVVAGLMAVLVRYERGSI
ncbi:hypothetical protein P8452_02882 [Trifolium repens]|nr:hypothetical protein P8452_02882 [Trifolium repens]